MAVYFGGRPRVVALNTITLLAAKYNIVYVLIPKCDPPPSIDIIRTRLCLLLLVNLRAKLFRRLFQCPVSIKIIILRVVVVRQFQ